PAAVAEALSRHRGVAAVLLTHNETSTGVANPVQAIAEVVRPTGALLLVDAVSSLAALDLRTDAWGVDVVVSGSQKALMAPPGASDTVTAVRLPQRVDGKALLRRLRQDHGVALAGGQGKLEGVIFRIGHMGYVQESQILSALEALEHVLAQLGHPVKRGAAVEAAAAGLRAR